MSDTSQLEFQLNISILELVPPLKTALPSHSASTFHNQPDISKYATSITNTITISQNEIKYRAEGNANIVLALPSSHLVLRLPKKTERSMNCSSSEVGCENRTVFVYKYIDCLSSIFVGPNLSNRPHLVHVKLNDIQSFNMWLHNHRPKHRVKSSNGMDSFNFEYGLLYHDACSLKLNAEIMDTIQPEISNTLAVEIKPKQGWNICSLQHDWLLELFGISGDLRNKCRFCAMQYLKVQGHQAESISKYCPLDLFSGNELRMRSSIRNLIDTPQNNLRVFHNGKLGYSHDSQQHDLHQILEQYFGSGSSSEIIDEFVTILVKILEHNFVQEGGNTNSECSVESSSGLTKGSILHRVLDLQQLAMKAMPIVAQTRDKHENHSQNTQLCDKLLGTKTLESFNYEDLKRKLNLADGELYEIGATALDCSIMLTLQSTSESRPNDSRYPIMELNGKYFFTNATVFDLDPKQFSQHLSKYIKKTKSAYNAYKCHLSSENK